MSWLVTISLGGFVVVVVALAVLGFATWILWSELVRDDEDEDG